MESSAQLPLPMLTHYLGPRLLPAELIMATPNYREAVRLCWRHRTRKTISQATICEGVNEQQLEGKPIRPSHLTEYLSADPSNREMPARFITSFENVMGNRAITQWITRRAGLHHLEQLIEQQRLVA